MTTFTDPTNHFQTVELSDIELEIVDAIGDKEETTFDEIQTFLQDECETDISPNELFRLVDLGFVRQSKDWHIRRHETKLALIYQLTRAGWGVYYRK